MYKYNINVLTNFQKRPKLQKVALLPFKINATDVHVNVHTTGITCHVIHLQVYQRWEEPPQGC